LKDIVAYLQRFEGVLTLDLVNTSVIVREHFAFLFREAIGITTYCFTVS